MPLISRTSWPNGGWEFFQPETNWRAPQPMSDNFSRTVDRIIAMRRNNPRFGLSLDPERVATELDTYTCHRLKFNPKWCIPQTAEKKTALLPPRPPRNLAARLVDRARQLANGLLTLHDWIGKGAEPVTPELSTNRATVCETCPQNVPNSSPVTEGAAQAILEQVRLKNHLAMTVPNESALGTCAACGCHLPLKVHVPIETIRQHMAETEMQALDPRCWILFEAEDQDRNPESLPSPA